MGERELPARSARRRSPNARKRPCESECRKTHVPSADTVINRLQLKHAGRDLFPYFPGRGDTNTAILIALASGLQNEQMVLPSGNRSEASLEQLEMALAATADIADSLTAAVRQKLICE